MSDSDPEAYENALLEDMRSHGGKVTTGFLKGESVMALTSTGARTGQLRRRILNFSRDGEAYVVAGTAGGAPKDPHWISNVRVNPEVSVEADGRVFEGMASVAAGESNPERIRLWDQHVAAIPRFAAYPEQAGRPIPMVRITPGETTGPRGTR
ncbi:MAG: nitroreductase family deazaflavin-dependent oxidoreductase [Chloroflexi bacterium]|nr:nitroreductase family deazaflavin-dependent oxidoreductase [Chloroflexota bacterium]